MPFLTPDDSGNPAVSVALTLPPDLLNALSGVIYELSLVENWEQFGNMTPDQCTAIFSKAWRNLSVDNPVLYEHLIAAWELGEPSGLRLDSHRTHHLADNNLVGVRTGVVGDAASFSRASANYLTVNDHADFDFSAGSWTICGWVSLDDKTTSQRIIRKAITNQLEFFAGYNLGNDRFILQVSENGTTLPHTVSANNFGSPTANTWYMVALWRDPVLDLLGIQVNDTTPNILGFSGNIYNGSSPIAFSDPAQALNGGLDQFYIWDTTLSSDYLKWLYNSGNGRKYTEVITYTG